MKISPFTALAIITVVLGMLAAQISHGLMWYYFAIAALSAFGGWCFREEDHDA